MGADSTPSVTSSRALKGIHGVQVVYQSPYTVESRPLRRDVDLSDTKDSVDTTQRLLFQRIWQQRPACFRPIHCCVQGDQHIAETIANVLTSLPFIFLGCQAPRKNLSTSLYANSLIGVGVASCLYHSSRGHARKILRWMDYTMIATTSLCLSGALRNENPRLLMAASAFLLPFQPMMVSALHTGMMEVAFARRASTKPELRTAHNLHTVSSLLGGALFCCG